ncbi:MAG: glycosyltransferase family 4 protein [Actinobacteria bacterium]|nr:glycosyltransferase family 4 protein [Actinomycetota bacterium]
MSVRVLHVVATNERRGAELFAVDLVRALRNEGLEQRVAVLRATEGVVASFDAPTHALGGPPAGRFGIARARSLRRLVRGWRPQVVQAHGGEALKYSVPAALGSGIPVVYRRIGSAHPWVTDAARRGLYGWLIRRADLVIGVSEVVRRETVDVYGVRLDRTLVVPNGVDPDRVRASRTRDAVRASLGVGQGAQLLLSVGALTWEKDPLALLDVAGRVFDVAPHAHLVLAGSGPLRSRVESAVRSGRHAERIRLLGSRDDVGDLLAASDVLVLSSRTEGMPGALIEAGLAGLPVASYAVGGVPEVVEDGVTGLLAPPGDRAALAEGVLRLILDPELRATMGRVATERIHGRFDIATIARRYAEVYRTIVGAPTGADLAVS